MQTNEMTYVQPQPFGFWELFRLKNAYSRQRYWATGILAFIINIVSSFVLGAVAAAVPPVLLVSFIVSVAIGWIIFATSVKRLRDADVSLWWLLLNFVPFVNFVSIIVFGCIGSSPTKNTKSAKGLLITILCLFLIPVVLGVAAYLVYNKQNTVEGMEAAVVESVEAPFAQPAEAPAAVEEAPVVPAEEAAPVEDVSSSEPSEQ